MYGQMAFQLFFAYEFFRAHLKMKKKITNTFNAKYVHIFVVEMTVRLGESTYRALEVLITAMASFMHNHVAGVSKLLATNIAGIWLFAGMCEHMFLINLKIKSEYFHEYFDTFRKKTVQLKSN